MFTSSVMFTSSAKSLWTWIVIKEFNRSCNIVERKYDFTLRIALKERSLVELVAGITNISFANSSTSWINCRLAGDSFWR